MSKIRTEDGFQYEMTRAEVEERFYGDVAEVLGQPKPKGVWEALLTAPVLDEEARKDYLSKHCYSPLVRKLLQESIKGDDK